MTDAVMWRVLIQRVGDVLTVWYTVQTSIPHCLIRMVGPQVVNRDLSKRTL